MTENKLDWEAMGFGPFPVSVVENFKLELQDGVHMAIKLWLPTDLINHPGALFDAFRQPDSLMELFYEGKALESPEEKFPGILEFLPYCKDIFTAPRDQTRHSWFCSHGYVCVRPDMRGSGASEGLYFDEYEPQEQQDCIEVINWIAGQPWSNGRVGMYGKSWGGFNGLQLAYLQPQPLKAVISAYSTDDRFSDDIHYMGGCMLGNGMLSWSSQMFIWNARPPHPKYFYSLDHWKRFWHHRLDQSSDSFLKIWLNQQSRSDLYWANGSINIDIDRVQCPILIIGGLVDAYVTAAFRMAGTLNDKSRAVIGPWSHEWPDLSNPGPTIDFLGLCLSWWDRHLKDKVQKEELPRLSCFVRDAFKPAFFHEEFPGHWVQHPNWIEGFKQYKKAQITGNSEDSNAFLNTWHLGETDQEPIKLFKNVHQGLNAGEWMSCGRDDLPGDQAAADKASSFYWESKVLEQSLVIAGHSCALLNLRATAEGHYGIAVRLCHLWPTGEATLITRGIQNLSDSIGTKFPANQDAVVTVELTATTYTVPAGHKLCVCISPTYFPMMFPFTGPGDLILSPGCSKVILQVLPQAQAMDFPGPKPLLQLGNTLSPPAYIPCQMECKDGKFLFKREENRGKVAYPSFDLVTCETALEEYETNEQVDKGLVKARREIEIEFPSYEMAVKIQTVSELVGGEEEFQVKDKLDISINDEKFFNRDWEYKIPRVWV